MSPSAYLAVCAMFRNEAPYLAEWIEFHRLVGVEHFFLYDNFSDDLSRAVLEPYVRAGVVTVAVCPIPLAAGGQAWVYVDGLERARRRARWLAYIDIDEFLFSPEHASLADVLPDYERHPGVVVNWQVYGSSRFDVRPPGLVIENFVARARTNWVRNRRVKSIVDPARAVRARGPHFFEYEQGALPATENHEPVRVVRSRASTRRLRQVLRGLPLVETDPYAIHHSSVKGVSVQRLRINHYAVKSRQEFADKVARHAAPGEPHTRRSRIAPPYFVYHDHNEVHDPILVGHAPEVRSRLNGSR